MSRPAAIRLGSVRVRRGRAANPIKVRIGGFRGGGTLLGVAFLGFGLVFLAIAGVGAVAGT